MNGAGGAAMARIALFLQALRENGFIVGLAETEAAARIAAHPDYARMHHLHAALRALCAGDRESWTRFDEIFDAHFRARGVRSATKLIGAAPAASKAPRLLPSAPGEGEGNADRTERRPGGAPNPADGRSRRAGASTSEGLAQTDFRHIADPAQLAEAHELAHRLAARMRRHRLRRTRAHKGGERLDLRRTIRASIAHGGVPIERILRRRVQAPSRLVVLLDASGSMSLYSSVFVRFVHGVLEAFDRADAFVFHTRLVPIGPTLRERDPDRAMARMALIAQGWHGGTRIGDSLATFNRHHAARTLGGRSLVLILSDGYETGPPERLAAEMAMLRRRCRRIAWLNPLLGWEGYTPTAAGMQAALPFVDVFAPAHNLASLAALEPLLTRL